MHPDSRAYKTVLAAIMVVIVVATVIIAWELTHRPAGTVQAQDRTAPTVAAPIAHTPTATAPAATLTEGEGEGKGETTSAIKKPETPAPTATPTAKAITTADIPRSGSRTWKVSDQLAPINSDGRKLRVYIRIEKDLPFDVDATSARIMKTLQDDRGWQPIEHVAFVQVNTPDKADVTLNLATPATVDAMCAPLRTLGKLSCRNGHNVMYNADRWVSATDEFDNLDQYRDYLINHEVGHALGHGHQTCPGPGKPAPLMQQQTKGLQGCKPNGWPSVG